MKVIWQANDGYATGSRPQTTFIPDDELGECESEEQKQKLISEYIKDDFDQKIGWEILYIEE